MAKPLMSRLIVGNATPGQLTPGISGTQANSTTWITSQSRDFSSAVAWTTPKKAQELKDQLRTLVSLDAGDHTARLLFRKVQKAYDSKDFELAKAQARIKDLEAQLEDVRPRKRKKVKISPNSKFADIRAIHRA